MIANETTIHQRQIDTEVNFYFLGQSRNLSTEVNLFVSFRIVRKKVMS